MNVLVILADDMRYELLQYMPFTYGTLRAEGTQFTNMRLNVPICQPARIGILTGQYAKGALNGTYQNSDGIGGTATDSIGIWLQAEGVTTGIFGKAPNIYKNGSNYPTDIFTPYAGWDDWSVFNTGGGEQEPYNFSIVAEGGGGTTVAPGPHQVNYLRTRLNNFVTGATEPWFAWYNPTNPHITNSLFKNNPLPSSMNKYNWKRWDLDLLEDDELSDKPSWIASKTQLSAAEQSRIRAAIRQQLREVYDLDQAIEGIYNDLQSAGALDDTLIIFTSDNGVFYGEMRDHNVATASKDSPYEPAVKVPMILRGPNVPAGGTNLTPVCHQDITATALAAAGAAGVDQDGHDLMDYIQNPDEDRGILYERRGHSTQPDADGIFKANRKLIRYHEGTGTPAADFTANPEDEYEAYDLDSDPHEKINWAYDALRLSERDTLEGELDILLGS